MRLNQARGRPWAGCCTDLLNPPHLTDKPTASSIVAYWSNNGQWPGLALNGLVANDPMYGPAVRCKWILPSWR